MHVVSARFRTAALFTSLFLAVGVLQAPVMAGAASAAPTAGARAVIDGDPTTIEPMGDYVAEWYETEAAELPVELADAISADLGISAEEYLAQSAAAAQGASVVESLEATGVSVLGSRMDGTTLVVNVESDADANAVSSAGGVAEWGAPTEEESLADDSWPIEPVGDVSGGQGIYFGPIPGSGSVCSVGFTGFALPGATKRLVTAGHCNVAPNSTALKYSPSIWAVKRSSPSVTSGDSWTQGDQFGASVAGTFAFGGGSDVGLVDVSNASTTARPSVLSWGSGGSSASPPASTPVTGASLPIVGASVCRSGDTSGWRCGVIEQIGVNAEVGLAPNSALVTSVVTSMCSMPGDSGGSALMGTLAVGITSWRQVPQGTPNTSCPTGTRTGLFAMRGGASVQSKFGSAWEPAVTVSTPVITSPPNSPDKVSGTIANANGETKVSVYLDSSTTPFATVSASSGSWSVPFTGVSSGAHTVRVEGRWGVVSKSAQASTTAFVVAVDRIAGGNRWETSAAIARQFPTASTVYVANGYNYPDALSAAPAAAHKSAPLLLTDPQNLPGVVADEILRLRPTRIVVVGGTAVVSEAVRGQLEALYGGTQVVRLAGATRYETSRVVSEDAFAAGTTTNAFVATGTNYPDALSASAAAAKLGGPVILVPGSAGSVDSATAALLDDFGTTRVYIAGGTSVVSSGMQSSIDSLAGVSVTRLGGADRYTTSVAINNTSIFPTATDAYLAAGTGFADALAGAALAGRQGAPLFVVTGGCVPETTMAQLKVLKVTKVHLLGGTSVLDANVAALRTC